MLLVRRATIQTVVEKLFCQCSKIAHRVKSYVLRQPPIAQGQQPLAQQAPPLALELEPQEQQQPNAPEQAPAEQEQNVPALPKKIPAREPDLQLYRESWITSDFLDWLADQKKYHHFLCPASHLFLLNPAPCLDNGNLFVELSHLLELRDSGKETLEIQEAPYPLEVFAFAVDERRRQENIEALMDLQEAYEAESYDREAQDMADLAESRGNIDNLKKIPGCLAHLQLKRCSISGEPIRFVVAPNTKATRTVYYEKTTLEQWAEDHPDEAPNRWPLGALRTGDEPVALSWPPQKEDVKIPKRTQEEIDEILIAAIEEIHGARQLSHSQKQFA
jgi:hypothetical protein